MTELENKAEKYRLGSIINKCRKILSTKPMKKSLEFYRTLKKKISNSSIMNQYFLKEHLK